MWSVNYCLLVFLSVLGVLQLAAAYNNFRSLFFFPSRGYTVGFAVLIIGFALFSFFNWNEFNTHVVEGGQQTGSFIFSTGVAILFTLVVSSILNYKRVGTDRAEDEGLEALRESTYFQVFRNHKNGKEQ
jgi:hypothetical protein